MKRAAGMTERTLFLMLAAVSLGSCLTTGCSSPSDERPDFSGTWKFLPERSSLQIAPPESSILTVTHNDPDWRLERTHVFDGRPDTITIELATDGAPVVHEIGGTEHRSRLYWEGDTLVFHTEATWQGEAFTTVVRYRLEDEGRTFIGEERMRGGEQGYDNLWVFEKQ